jgi:MoxR-like ATPase
MSKKVRYPAEEVAQYLVDRLGRERTNRSEQMRGRVTERPVRTTAGQERVPGSMGTDAEISEIGRLVLEKEDLLRQIASDETALTGHAKSMTQDEIIRFLDDGGEPESFDMRGLARGVGTKQGFAGSLVEAKHRLAEVESGISRLIADPRIREGYKRRLSGKIRAIRGARTVGSLQKLIEKTELARMEWLARRNDENVTLTRADNEIIRKYELIRQKAQAKSDSLMSREEVYYEARRRDLLEYRRQLLTDGFVETASIKDGILRIVSHLELGIPVLLRGHLGTGKTEIALHVSRKYLGCEPEFVSGSEEATKYDIYGKTQIGVRPEDDKIREFKYRMDEYLRMNPETGRKELKEIEKQYYQTIVVKGLTTSFFQYGPLVRAMKKGVPLIIDEMDGIPHSIIMRLNHVLTRKPGDRVRVQENGGEEIAVNNGFCVLATGNIKSGRYKREELDAAFLSRWWSNDINYPPRNETYEILVASLLDRRGDLLLKQPEDLDDLKRLTEAASEIQEIFAGEKLDYFGEGGDAARETPAGLKKSVLSLRHLWNIVRPWKAHNFDRPLEAYILNEFIRPAVSEDQVYLVQLFCRFRFFKAWKSHEFGIPGLTEVKLLAFQGKQALHKVSR